MNVHTGIYLDIPSPVLLCSKRAKRRLSDSLLVGESNKIEIG